MPHDATQGQSSSSRPKLDPRLALLLEMDEGGRSELKRHEDLQLKALGDRLREELVKLEAVEESGRDDAEQRVNALKAQMFAPMSCGLHEAGAAGVSAKLEATQAHISAFIVADAGKADLEAMGARIRSHAGDVFTAFIPMSSIQRLEDSPAVRYIELARPLFQALDFAVKRAQIDLLRRPPSSATGRGTIVGIIDSTLDIYHPDFRRPSDNSTRIRFLWDQILTAREGESGPPPGLLNEASTYGVEYTAEKIDEQLFAFRPSSAYDIVRHNAGGEIGSHGTHVTGIAAGNGRAQPTSGYVGAAPEADIIFVAHPNLHDGGMLADSVHVIDAFEYIFARAAELNMPCVVNMSNGDNLGPHDGSSVGERYLDGLLEIPGRAITLSAGNSAGTGSHASGTVAADAPKTIGLECREGATRSDTIEIWYAGQDLFDVTLVTVEGVEITVRAGDNPPPQSLGNGVRVAVKSLLGFPLNGDNRISIMFLVSPEASIPPGTMKIVLHGAQVTNGAFHAWIDRNNRTPDGKARLLFTSDVDETLTLGSPGTARRPITVGNHGRDESPVISKSSGRGPTRDRRVKPECAAVGNAVMSPYSWNRRADLPTANYATFEGTSASAPLVAGACACLFQVRGATLTWANIKQIIEETAGSEGIDLPSTEFGFGYVQLGKGAVQPLPDVDVWLKDNLADIGVEPNTHPVTWVSPDIELLDMSRRPLANPVRRAPDEVSNIIRIRVRNRGTQSARNTEVHLGWAEPTTNIPQQKHWRTPGLFIETGGRFAQESSTIAIPTIPPGGFRDVEFGWAPPARFPGQRALERFCLLVRLENQNDPTSLDPPHRVPIATRNNIAVRHLHVEECSSEKDATAGFILVGTHRADPDSLTVTSELAGGEVMLTLPVQSLPWRDATFAGGTPPDGEFTTAQAEALTGARNAGHMIVHDGAASFVFAGAGPLLIPDIRLPEGERMEVAMRVSNARIEEGQRHVHVAHRSGGELVGGVTIELREAAPI